MAVSPNSTATLRITVQIPQSALSIYEAEAERKGVPLESVIASRLAACASHNSIKPIYISDEQRQELQKAVGKVFKTPEDLLAAVRNALRLSVQDTNVTLQPILITRLRSRCFGKPFNTFLQERVLLGLEEFAGMR